MTGLYTKSSNFQLHSRNGSVLNVQASAGSRIGEVEAGVICAFCYSHKVRCSHFCCTHTVCIPVCTDYCIILADVSSLSLSRSPKGSASLAFQRSSQSEEIYTCPNITFNMCEVKYVPLTVFTSGTGATTLPPPKSYSSNGDSSPIYQFSITSKSMRLAVAVADL